MKKPPEPIGKKRGKRAELDAWIARSRPQRIGEAEQAAIAAALAPISENYLRKLLRECGVPLDPMVDGVRQADLAELERSLIGLLDRYESADSPRRNAIRRMVITAKDHARWAVRAHPEKAEMILWMTTWLENPPLFREWVRLRRKAFAEAADESL